VIGYYQTYIGYLDVIKGYSDANWVTDSNIVKSTTGYIYSCSVVLLCPENLTNK